MNLKCTCGRQVRLGLQLVPNARGWADFTCGPVSPDERRYPPECPHWFEYNCDEVEMGTGAYDTLQERWTNVACWLKGLKKARRKELYEFRQELTIALHR